MEGWKAMMPEARRPAKKGRNNINEIKGR